MADQNHRTRGKRPRLGKDAKSTPSDVLGSRLAAAPGPLVMSSTLYATDSSSTSPFERVLQSRPRPDSAHLSLLLPRCSPFRDPIVTSSTRPSGAPQPTRQGYTHLGASCGCPPGLSHRLCVPGRSWAMVGSCSRTFYDSGARLSRARGEPQRTKGPESQYRKDILAVCPHRDAGAELGDVLSGWWGGRMSH